MHYVSYNHLHLRSVSKINSSQSLLNASKKQKSLRDRLESTIIEKVGQCEINGGATERLPNTTSIGFKYIEGEAIL